MMLIGRGVHNDANYVLDSVPRIISTKKLFIRKKTFQYYVYFHYLRLLFVTSSTKYSFTGVLTPTSLPLLTQYPLMNLTSVLRPALKSHTIEHVVSAVLIRIAFTVASNLSTANRSFTPATPLNSGNASTTFKISVRISLRVSGMVKRKPFFASFKAQRGLQKALTASFSS